MAIKSNRGMMFSVWSEQYPHDATVEELLGEAFSMWSVLRLHGESIVLYELSNWKPVSLAQELQ
jgi:hypothetical protein